MGNLSKTDKIDKILEINPNAKRDELERLSGEHLGEVFRYWIDQGITKQLARIFNRGFSDD